MATFKVDSFAKLTRLMDRHGIQRTARVIGAVKKSARSTERYIDNTTMPIAFGGLKDSGHVEPNAKGAKVVYDAPYSMAVELGSRPHWMPLQPLIEWVKLRGMQALTARGNIKSKKGFSRLKGTTTEGHARSVAEALRNTMFADGSDALPINAPEQVARAIQVAIAKRGTKPHWFAKKSLPAARAYLSEFIKKAIQDK